MLCINAFMRKSVKDGKLAKFSEMAIEYAEKHKAVS